MSTPDGRRRIDNTGRYRVTFAKEMMGLRFPVAFVEVHRARDPDRARRAAELRFTRRYGLDWRMQANVQEVEAMEAVWTGSRVECHANQTAGSQAQSR